MSPPGPIPRRAARPRHFAAAALLAALVLVLAFAPPARADLNYTLQSVTAAAGSSGNAFDIMLTNTGAPVTISGFTFGISASSGVITLTSATTGTVSPYIFSGHSALGPVIDDGPGQSMTGGDVYAPSGSGTSIGTNTTLGLAHVFFSVAAGASGTVDVTFTPLRSNTLAGPSPSSPNLPITSLTGGRITITPAAVPEPSVAALAALGLLGVAGRLALQRLRARDDTPEVG